MMNYMIKCHVDDIDHVLKVESEKESMLIAVVPLGYESSRELYFSGPLYIGAAASPKTDDDRG